MSGFELDFEQLRDDIFSELSETVDAFDYCGLHAAIQTGFDPRQLAWPKPQTALTMPNYGTLSFEFHLPLGRPAIFSILFSLDRLSYSIQIDSPTALKSNMRSELTALSVELGLRCDIREVGKTVRIEISSVSDTAWSDSVISVLKDLHNEGGFKESVRLRTERLMIGLAAILAAGGIIRRAQGAYLILLVKNAHDISELNRLIDKAFERAVTDNRDGLNYIYALVTKEPDPNSIAVSECIEELKGDLAQAGFSFSMRNTQRYIHTRVTSEE